MDSDLIQLIVRSRPVILEILEGRGYDCSSYKDVHPEEIQKFAHLLEKEDDLLRIIVPKRADSIAGAERCIVLYWTFTGSVRLRLEKLCSGLFDTENPSHYNKDTDEIIVIISEPPHEVFDTIAVKMWSMNKIRINFFHVKNLITNPAKHYMVPPHRKLSQDEINNIIHQLHMKSKNELPHIKYHRDIQTRVLGLVPGDVVEIKRPSETSGIFTLYRICTP